MATVDASDPPTGAKRAFYAYRTGVPAGGLAERDELTVGVQHGVGATARWLGAFVAEAGACADADAVLRAAVAAARDGLAADTAALVVDGQVVHRAGTGPVDGAGAEVPVPPGQLIAVRQEPPLGPDDVDLLAALAAVTTQAVATRELARRHALAGWLATIHRAVAGHESLPDIFDMVTSSVRDLLGDDLAGLRLMDADEPDTLLLVSCQGLPPQRVHRLWRAPVAEAGVAGRAVATGELVVFAQYPTADGAIGELVEQGVSAAMAAPVRDGGTVTGALVVASCRPERRFDGTDREMLAALAEAVGLAITASGSTYHVFHDRLTGLTSRALFLDRLTHTLSRGERDRSRTGLLVIGLDRFKTVNDALGHAAGDLVLAAVAERLRGAVRGSDTAARFDGDEFAVLLYDIGQRSEAMLIARRIVQAMRAPFSIAGRQVFLTASIGVVLAEPGQADPHALLRWGSQALATAKRNGKDRYEVFAPPQNPAVRNPVELEADLHRALERDELTLRYQPIVELATGRITGFEALVRWQHP